MFDDFVRHCRTEAGYATLKSVSTKEKADEMQSFLAETFKYFYPSSRRPDARLPGRDLQHRGAPHQKDVVEPRA